MWFTEHFLKHKASRRFILFLDSHRAPYYCYRLLLKIRLQSFVYRGKVKDGKSREIENVNSPNT
jgi:hypothetical protein